MEDFKIFIRFLKEEKKLFQFIDAYRKSYEWRLCSKCFDPPLLYINIIDRAFSWSEFNSTIEGKTWYDLDKKWRLLIYNQKYSTKLFDLSKFIT